MRTTEEGIQLIKRWEGFVPTAYQDMVGVWTIGYGTTEMARVGIAPRKGLRVTEAEADTYLRKYVEREEKNILALVSVPLNDNQLSALSSFVYNLGLSAFKGSTLLKKLNLRDYQGASAEFLKWDKARVNGVLAPSKGLTERRKAERALFDKRATQVAETKGGLLEALLELLRGIFK